MKGTQFKKLFEPFQLGRIQLKNRIVMPPMATHYATEEGYVSPRLIDYYEARARGGVGMIIVEVTAPDLQCRGPHQLSLGDDRYIPGWQELIGAVHRHGAKIAVQLQHSSIETRDSKVVQVGPSAVIVPARVMGVIAGVPHELTADEIEEIVQWFAAAALRAKKAGFDGVEVHGAHQYLIASFLSSATNMRQDKYGGSLENRARFLIEILQAIKGAVGDDFPVWTRLNGQEFGVENGVTIDETRQIVPMAVDAGAQAIHVSGYSAGSFATKAPISDTPGFLVPLAAEVKKVAGVPVLVAGRLDAELGEKVLEEGKADLISIGRRLMADPEFPNKVAESRFDEINPCIGCMECMERPDVAGEGRLCTINAAMGRESEYRITPAGNVKEIVVVGGGPAGMEAALVAALRGHHVVLFEKGTKLGGQMNVASLPPHKEDIIPWINYMARRVEKSGVKIKLGIEATPELITASQPDAVVIATGGIPVVPEITGADRPYVVTAQDVLSGKAKVGQNVVIIGGGMVGCETAHYLAERGKKVVIVEILKRMAADMLPMVRRRLMDGLRAKQVIMLTEVTCEEIAEGAVTVTTGEGQKDTIQADTVILAVGYRANDELYRELRGKVPEVYCIGDSAEPRRIIEAVNEGYRFGLSL